jgi:large subunit ribosomal protein L25
MSHTISLAVERRTASGKGGARQLRLHGRVPAVIYGHGRQPEALSVGAKDLEQALAGIAAEATLFDLAIDGAPVKALIREIQRHPFRSQIIHVDFYEIHAGERVTLEVPVHLVGSPDGVRNGGGVLDQLIREVKIRVLPTDIPEHIDVDVTELRVGQSLHASDLTFPTGEILTEPTTAICTVVPPRVEAEEVAAVVTPEEAAEPELIRKAKEDEEEGEESEE